FVIYGLRQQKLRTEGMRRVAADMGYAFFANGDGKTLEELGRFHLFSRGGDRTIRNLIQGKADKLEIKIFDYQHVLTRNDSDRRRRQTVICFRSPDLALPDFSLRPRGGFHKVTSALGLGEIAALFGYREIVIGDRVWFSKYYLLRGEDEAAV